jgi:predicted ABC-type ATPase
LIIGTIDALAEGGESFVLETTLSGGWLDGRVEDWRARDCEIGLIYLKLASPDLAIQRVSPAGATTSPKRP